MVTWPSITRDDLLQAREFDRTFPLLIRRLILETGKGVTRLHMPGGSGTSVGGFDGVVAASGETPFVPAGTSVWELSVTGKAGKKADEDYDKRTAGPEGTPTNEVTYVQVILATWRDAEKWATQRKREGRWKDVRAYNADDVHTWLEAAPATTIWLAERLGKAMPGVHHLESWWSGTWLPSTQVPLTADIVLAGREKAAASFLQRLREGPGTTSLGEDLRFEEAKAFVAACLEQARDLDEQRLSTRTFFVTDRESLVRLAVQPQPMVLLLEDRTMASAIPEQTPHHIVLLAPPGRPGDVPVPPVDGQAVRERLEASLPYEKAVPLGVLARRSLLALRRALAVRPDLWTPPWASEPDVFRRRLLLLGAWDGTNEHDRRVVEQCVGRPYSEVQEAALKLAAVPDTPFVGHLDEQWHLVSPKDAWTLLAHQLMHDDLRAFQEAVLEVLGERDPMAGLKETEQWKANLQGARRKYSSRLRKALAQTLALLGSNGERVRAPSGMRGSQWVRLPVRKLFSQANADETYALWTSLCDVLPLLAEAAPEEFLQAIQDGLAGPSPLHARMFTDKTPDEFGLSPASPHTAFLCALEGLAWSADYFDEAVDVLGQLAALDPGGQWDNRPSKSLASIFSCWLPSTSADLDQRIRALRRLLRNEPDEARKLLITLISSGDEIQFGNYSPQFQNWKQESVITRPDQRHALAAVTDLILDDLDEDGERHLALIEKVDSLLPEQRQEFVERLTRFGASLSNETARNQLFNKLRDKIAHHQEYADAFWALPAEELQKLQAAADAIKPQDSVRRNAWLFTDYLVELGDLSFRNDYSAYEAAVSERRAAAVGEILQEGGLPAVMALASGTEFPGLVGSALAAHSNEFDAEMLSWLREDQPSKREVAFAYFTRRLHENGTNLCDRLLEQTDDPSTQARILRATCNPPSAWKKLSELNEKVSKHYWREFIYYGLGSSFDHVLEAVHGLISVGRNAAALDLMSIYANQSDSTQAAEVIAEALEGLLKSESCDPELPRLKSYSFERLFKLLARHCDEVGRLRVLRLEWQFFPTFSFNADAPTLHTELATNPVFFTELIGHIYRRDRDGSPETNEADQEQRRIIAKRSFQVLHRWRRCPGVTPEGTIDATLLRDWISSAREELRSLGLLDRGDSHIGQVLAYAPPDPDGSFPPEAVRVLLEEIQSDRLDNGLRIGILNKRGVVSRGLDEGGDQEWKLVKKYRDQAKAAAQWPRTRKLLNKIAEFYEAEARENDDEAERYRRGLDD
ncbi:hypothetical protein [Thermomonospora curvata]|uniref:Uncharacterized protein n=1 Tax=Thermomonospora curvata (strain ATCC 19995 / DSM 43183 / JCM 3096 / KCTC 9072 / NBRC 15933 / NCIMB 10081 / Henssen B9) TaxID=471852 RepID=D1A4T8_THECD|nr:hypothetical protein [Thermomonospora curvata]ACY98107.1 conserved hypothetical protein [Thermomonospora curvata DSM 43183]